MAEQAPKQSKPPQNALVIGQGNEMLKPLQTEDAKAIINSYLLDAKGIPKNPDITYDRLLLDLAGSVSVNPDLQTCSAGSFFNCMAFAARHGMTFGDGGVWLIPRDKKGDYFQNATPQLSARGMVARTKEVGVDRIEVVLVCEGDKLEVLHDDAGQITKISHTFDHMEPRNFQALKAAFGVAIFSDGAKRISYYTGADIMGRRDYSAAENSLMWKKAPWKAYERSVKASVAKELVGDFTRGAGQMGSLALPSSQDSIDAEFETVEEKPEIPFESPTAAAAAELDARVDALDTRADAIIKEEEGNGDQPAPEPQSDPPQLVGFPELPPTMTALRDGSHALQLAVDALQVAWSELPMNDQALSDCWAKDAPHWGHNAENSNVTNALSGLKSIVWKAASDAGYPQK